MTKIYLDAGHGGRDSGAKGNGLLEKDVNLKIVLKIRDLLKKYDVDVKMSRTTDKTVSLKARTDEANTWGADYFVSVHCNAFNGSANGYEDFIFNGLTSSSRTARLRNTMHTEIIKQVDFANRGKKRQNFHVLRETHMGAILTENGFLDNQSDANKLKKDSYLNRIAKGHVNGLVKAFNLKEVKKTSDSDTFYRVITGSFNDKENAEKRMEELEKKGYESFIDTFKK